jgi:hypothetical protein
MYAMFADTKVVRMAAAGQLPLEELDKDEYANKKSRRGMALNLLKPKTSADVLKVKMAQELHLSLSGAEEVLRNLRTFDITVSLSERYCIRKKFNDSHV